MTYAELLRRIQEEWEDEGNWDEENIPPTGEAFSIFRSILEPLGGMEFPEGAFCGHYGGIRVEWESEDRLRGLRLQIFSTEGGRHYLYWEDGEDYGCIYNLSSETFRERMIGFMGKEEG